MNDEPFNSAEADIIEAIQALARHMDSRFDQVDLRFARIEERLDRIEFQISGHTKRIEMLEDKVLQLARHAGLSFN